MGGEALLRDATPEDVTAIARFQTDCRREAYRGLVSDSYLESIGADEREARWRGRLARNSASRQMELCGPIPIRVSG